jgi:hypothetical protein
METKAKLETEEVMVCNIQLRFENLGELTSFKRQVSEEKTSSFMLNQLYEAIKKL